MKILLTGATGYLGKQLVKNLLNSSEFNVLALVRNSKALQEFLIENNFSSEISIVSLKENNWKESVEDFQPELVIHLAAYLSSKDDEVEINKLINANILFGCNLLDALKKTKCRYFVNIGTFAEFKDNNEIQKPAYLYSATKSAFKNIINYYQPIIGFKLINVTPYTLYGGVDTSRKLIDYIFESLDAPLAIEMTPGKQILDFVHIRDVISFFKKLLLNLGNFSQPITELKLGTGIGISPKELALQFESVTKKKANINWGGLNYRPNDIMKAIADIKETSKIINWEPIVSVEEGIKEYIKEDKNGFQKS